MMVLHGFFDFCFKGERRSRVGGAYLVGPKSVLVFVSSRKKKW